MKEQKIIKEVILLMMLWLTVSSINAQTNTTIQAKLDDLQEGTVVYISPIASSTKKDSVIAGKGQFRFNLKLDEGDIYILRIGKTVNVPGYASIVYLQPGVFKIKAKGPLLTGVEYSGSAYAKELNDLNKFIKNAPSLSVMDKLVTALNESYKNKDSVTLAELRPRYQKLDSVRTGLYKEWISKHPSSPISAMALSLYVREKNMDELQNQLDLLKPEAKQNALVKKMQYSIDAAKLTAIGKPAPDFIQNDTSGRPVALKDFRGKYVLVDFWASWCVPCRAENPNVVKAFNRFKEKNFTVLGISLDRPDAKEKWLKAIHDDGLTWTHVSDLKYWDNEVSN
ncbi:MAG: redoxin domain-containing protein, partial [Flavisolibacter sp.]